MPIPIQPFWLPDTVIVFPRSWVDDADGAQVPVDGTGVTYAARVEPLTKTDRTEGQGTILGVIGFNVIFGVDPKIKPKTGSGPADVKIDWTAHGGVVFDLPILMMSQGAQQEPSGFDPITFWLVNAVRRS